MAITLRVEWSNKDDELLTRDARPLVHVSAGGVEVPPKPGSGGAFPDYEIPDTAASVRVEFAVIGTVKLQHSAQERSWRRFRGDISQAKIPIQRDFPVLLWALQEYLVNRSGDAPIQPAEPRHPLIDCITSGSPAGSVAKLHVWTDFLDVTDYYFDFAALGDERAQQEWERTRQGEPPQKSAEIYHSAHARELASAPADPMRMTVLGFTGGKPKMWFATYCEPRMNSLAGPEVGALVYYRPNTDPHSKVCELHPGMTDRNNRYFLAPNAEEFRQGVLDAADRIITKDKPATKDQPEGDWTTEFLFVRIGIDQAIQRSGKPVLLMIPYPHAHDYGRSETQDMPSLMEMSLRFLHGNGEISRNQPSVKLGRLGVAGYSAGGMPMGKAIRLCAPRLSEIYLFDSTGGWGYADQVMRWAWSTPGARLRISMGFNEKPMDSIYRGTLELIRKKQAAGVVTNNPENVTAWPLFSTGEEFLEKYDLNSWWKYYLSEVAARTEVHARSPAVIMVRHQFAMFGGIERPTTFLELFLCQSGY